MLTAEEAGARYLGIMCQRNLVNIALDDSYVAGENEFINGGAPDPAAVKAAGAESQRIARVTIELIDDPRYLWPDGVAENLETLKSTILAQSAGYNAIANASTYEDAYYVTIGGDSEEAGRASQEVRYLLGLPSNTQEGCEGMDTKADELHAEMTSEK